MMFELTLAEALFISGLLGYWMWLWDEAVKPDGDD